jgi:hypothetical protein
VLQVLRVSDDMKGGTPVILYDLCLGLDKLYSEPIDSLPEPTRHKLHALFMARWNVFHIPVHSFSKVKDADRRMVGPSFKTMKSEFVVWQEAIEEELGENVHARCHGWKGTGIVWQPGMVREEIVFGHDKWLCMWAYVEHRRVDTQQAQEQIGTTKYRTGSACPWQPRPQEGYFAIQRAESRMGLTDTHLWTGPTHKRATVLNEECIETVNMYKYSIHWNCQYIHVYWQHKYWVYIEHVSMKVCKVLKY